VPVLLVNVPVQRLKAREKALGPEKLRRNATSAAEMPEVLRLALTRTTVYDVLEYLAGRHDRG